jgi:hypothetical protein
LEGQNVIFKKVNYFMKHFFIGVLLLLFSFFSFAQENKGLDCSSLRQGTFKFLDIPDTTAYFQIEQSTHKEYYQSGKYMIQSRLEWLSDCQYKMTMLTKTLPDMPFKPGDVMIVTIKKIEGNVISYTAQVNDQFWNGRLLKTK